MFFKTIAIITLPMLLSACSLSFSSSVETSIDSYGDIKPVDMCNQLGEYDQCLVRRCFSEDSVSPEANNEMANTIYDLYLLSKDGKHQIANIYHNNELLNPKFKIEEERTLIYSNEYIIELKKREDKVLLTKGDETIHAFCYETYIKEIN